MLIHKRFGEEYGIIDWSVLEDMTFEIYTDLPYEIYLDRVYQDNPKLLSKIKKEMGLNYIER